MDRRADMQASSSPGRRILPAHAHRDGCEGDGARAHAPLRDVLVRLPQAGSVESLNVSVAAHALFEAFASATLSIALRPTGARHSRAMR